MARAIALPTAPASRTVPRRAPLAGALPESTALLEAMRDIPVTEGLLAVLDQLGLGLCLVDNTMRAMLVSGLALRTGAVRLRGGGIATAMREDEPRLRAAIAAALAGPDAPQQGVRLGTPHGVRLALVTGLRMPVQDAPRLAAVILLPQDRPEHPERVVQAMFGLSPVEARIARLLADGLTPNEAADRLRMRPNTLRGYMKSIFIKLDVHRQSELVRLITSSSGLLRGVAACRQAHDGPS